MSGNSTINVNEPVKNQSLVTAFEEYDANNDESKIRFRTELNRANFLVPYSPEDFQTLKSDNGTMTILPGSKLSFFLRNTQKGLVLSIATDWEGINKFLPKGKNGISAWIMPAKDVWEWVLSEDSNYAGVEILTSTQAYTLPKSYISTLNNSEL